MHDSYVFHLYTTQSSVLHLSNNDLLCIKCIMFCKFIGGETTHHRCLVSISPPVKSKEEKVLETDRETRERDRERESGRDWIFLSL